jgi:hypothetical protein
VGLPYQKKVQHIGYLNSIHILRKIFTGKFDDAHAPNNGRPECRRIRMLAGAKYSVYTNQHNIRAEGGELFRSERAYMPMPLAAPDGDKHSRAMSDSRFAITRPTRCHAMRSDADGGRALHPLT